MSVYLIGRLELSEKGHHATRLRGLRRAKQNSSLSRILTSVHLPRTEHGKPYIIRIDLNGYPCSISTCPAELVGAMNSYGAPCNTLHIAIPPMEAVEENKSDYIVMMPRNLKDEILQADDPRACPGFQFVIPSPQANVIHSRWSVL